MFYVTTKYEIWPNHSSFRNVLNMYTPQLYKIYISVGVRSSFWRSASGLFTVSYVHCHGCGVHKPSNHHVCKAWLGMHAQTKCKQFSRNIVFIRIRMNISYKYFLNIWVSVKSVSYQFIEVNEPFATDCFLLCVDNFTMLFLFILSDFNLYKIIRTLCKQTLLHT